MDLICKLTDKDIGEEFEKIELMARGGQKIVFDGVHNSYGETVIKLYFQLIHAPHIQ